jgi:membrane fusion protein, multidrug efflux system
MNNVSSATIDTAPGELAASRDMPWWRRRELQLVFGLLLGLLLVGCAAYWWRVGRFMQETDDAYVRADVVTISPRIAGYVANAQVDDNQPVKAGDVLVTIDDRDYRARVQQAEAAVAAASAAVMAQEAALANMDAQLTQQHSRIAKVEAESVAAAAESALADADQRRFATLVGQRAVSLQQAQNAETASRKAAAALTGSKADVTSEQQRVTMLRTAREQAAATLEQARATLQQAQASLRLANIDLDSTVIRAPVDGVTGQRSVRTGQYVEPGLPLLAVVPVQSAYVIANYKETQLHGMHPGQSVMLAVDGFDGARLHGHVESLSPASGSLFALLPPDNATGNFTKIVQRIPVKIALDASSKLALRPGMSVVATVDTRGGDDQHGG